MPARKRSTKRSKMMRILIIFLAPLIFSCKLSDDYLVSKIKHIDSITNDCNKMIHRSITHIQFLSKDTIFTHFLYDSPRKLRVIHSEESSTNTKYESYILNDSLIEIIIKNWNQNVIADTVAIYYIDSDTVLKTNEIRGKIQ